MREFVSNYLRTSQLLYDLVPVIACLGDDAYLADLPEGRSLLDQYYMMTSRVHIDLIKRAIVQRINNHLPHVS